MMLELHRAMSFTKIIIFTLMYSYAKSYLYKLQLRHSKILSDSITVEIIKSSV